MVNRFHALQGLTRLLHIVENTLFTGHCLLCGNSSNRPFDLCNSCENELPLINNQCHRCGIQITEKEHSKSNVCGKCLLSPPAFKAALCVWSYAPPLAQMISVFKYRRNLCFGRVLTELAIARIALDLPSNKQPDFLIPMPLHWKKQLKRGFNQSQFICQRLSKAFAIPIYHGVKRINSTCAQQSLNAQERKRNMKGAFHIGNPDVLRGMRVTIVDDVLTTGATANELSKTLLEKGVREVHVWCLSRTPL